MSRINQTLENRIVDLDRVRQNNIVPLDLGKPLNETIFQQEYQTAIRLINEIVQRSQDYQEKKKSCDSQEYLYKWTELQTAVPFIGDRGTGKTSMMVSVWNWLKKYPCCAEDQQFKLKDDPRFICLDMIDAGKLQGLEDMMEIILSRLLSYLQEHNQDCTGKRFDYRELYKKIDFLYKDLARTHWSYESKEEEAGLLQLQAIADSQKTSEQFRELVQEFAKTVGRDRTFLVIALDDIDMYQGSYRNGLQSKSSAKFILLEQIYNYLRTPNLILLVTFNETILRQTCIDHFRCLCIDPKEIKKDSSVAQQDVEALTRQFLSKLFPHEQRVYLPDFTRVASMNQVNLYIDPRIEREAIPPFKKNLEGDPEQINVKEFMLRLIAYRTGIYYDIKGNKKHFFEPRNLRELGSMIRVLEDVKEIPEKGTKEAREATQAQNRQMLLNYLYNQFSEDHLNREEYFAFSQLCTLPIFRQNRDFIDKVSGSNSETTPKERRTAYSYGEMLKSIYISTRNKTGVSYFSKEFIHCLLGTHSVILNQTARSYQSQDEWMKLIGSSIAGSWANDMLPVVVNSPEGQIGKEVEQGKIGSIHLPAQTFFELKLPSKLYFALFCIAGCKNTGFKPADAEKEVCSFIEAMVLLGMFFTGFPKNGLQLWLCPEMTKELNPVLKMTVKASSLEYLCFNAFNFVINSYLSSHPHTSCTVNGEKATYLEYIRKQLEDLGQSIAAIITNEEGFYVNQIRSARQYYNKMNYEIKERTEERKKQAYTQIEVSEKQVEDEKEKEKIAKWILNRFFGVTDNQIEYKVGDIADKIIVPNTQKLFIKRWNNLLDNVIGESKPKYALISLHEVVERQFTLENNSFWDKIEKWEQDHKNRRFTFPIQQFDMSYNIIKRLAHPAYYDRDIPTEIELSEAYDYFVSLYQSIENQLKEQDRVYCLAEEESFAKPYQDSVFYQRFVALANPKLSQTSGQNQLQGDLSESYLRTLFTEMLEQAVWENAARENAKTTFSRSDPLLSGSVPLL